MAKDVKRRFTVSLDIDTKDAEKQIKATVGNLKTILADMGNAADKMSYFKELVDYISQVDKALASLRASNKEAFDHMFDGLDTNLKKQLEGLFGSSEQLKQLDVLRDKLNNLTPKSSIEEIRKFAKELHDVFTALGATPTFDLDQIKGKGAAKHIETLSDALSNLAVIWGDVNSKISKGFGVGGGGGVAGPSKEIQEEIDRLKKQKDELQETLDAISKGSIKFNLVKDSKEQVEQLRELTKAFKNAVAEKERLEASGAVGTQEYLKATANAIKLGAQIRSAFEDEGLSDKAVDWINVNDDGITETVNLLFKKLETKNQELVSKIKNLYSDLIVDVDGKLNGLLSGTGAGSGSAFKEYDELIRKVKEYLELTKKLSKLDPSGSEYSALLKQRNAMSGYFLDREGLSEEAEDAVYDILAEMEKDTATVENITNQLCDLFKIEVPRATDVAAEAIGHTGQYVVSTTEYIEGMTLALKRMFDVMSQKSTVEYKVLVNGQEIDAWMGQIGEVSGKTTAEAYLANLGKTTDVDVHTHQGLPANVDVPDLRTAISRHYGGLTKLSAIVGGDSITTLDLTKVKAEDAYKALAKLEEIVKNSPLQSVSPNKINQIFGEINPDYSNIAQEWEPAKFDELAQKIFDVRQNTEQALTPLERFKNLLTVMTSGKIDLSKYEDLFNRFSPDNANSIFNQIMKSEKIDLQVDSVLPMSVEDVALDIARQKNEFLELRRAAKLTYSDISNEVKTYLSTGENRSFFEKFFHPQDMNALYGAFADVEDGILDLDTLTNRIASDFGIDPENFVKDMQLVEDSSEQAKAKLEEFFNLRTKIFGLEGGYTADDVDIGKYTERLDAAKRELDELGAQGLITADELREVQKAYDESKRHLKSETRGYTGYGSGYGDYSYSYYEEYSEAEARAEVAEERARAAEERAEEAEKRVKDTVTPETTLYDVTDGQLSFFEGMTQSAQRAEEEVEELGATIKEVGNLDGQISIFDQGELATQQAITSEIEERVSLQKQLPQTPMVDGQPDVTSNEINDLNQLREKLEEVKRAVEAKNKAFNDEGEVVGRVVGKEISALKQLLDIVDDITPKVNALVSNLANIDKGKKKLDSDKPGEKKKEETKKQEEKKDKAPSVPITTIAKYNSLTEKAKSKEFESSRVVTEGLQQLEAAYQAVIDKKKKLEAQDVVTDDDRAEFKNLTEECNKYAAALEKILKNSINLSNERVNKNQHILGADFDYSDVDKRKAALSNFAKEMYGVSLSSESFKKNFSEAVFAVDNGDGTFTKMTAKFTEARNEIVAMAGDTKKATNAITSFIEGAKGRIKSLAQYVVASLSIYDAWRVIQQGVTYVKEIDSALTELRKVTDQTEQEYKEFLQTMSQTASVTGSTVKDLTSSAADWARLNI